MRQITETEYERILDVRAQRALSRSSAYRNAENAQDQAQAEEDIVERIVAEMNLEYEVEN